jgi:Tfp pilus assembly protein FimT
MAIIVIISGLAILNWRGGEKQYALQRAASKLAQDIRRAEEMAISSKEFRGEIPKGGYGVYFKIQEKEHYILFADLNSNSSYDPGSDGLIEDVKIEKDIQISQLSASPLHIIFIPPDPEVKIRPSANEAQITLSFRTSPTKTKIIKVNKAGLIDID